MLTKNGRPFIQLETQLITHVSKMLITDTNKHHVLHYKENPLFFLHDIIYYERNSVKFKKIMYDGCQRHHLPSSVKFNRKCLIFFLWLILNILLAIAASQNNTFCHTYTGGCPNGVVWRYAF